MTALEEARLATVDEHVRAENAGDLDAIMGTFAANEQIRLVYNGAPTTGHAKVRRSYEIGITALPDFRFEVLKRHVSNESIIAEHVLHFSDPEGEKIEVPMCIVYAFDEAGKLNEERIYFDEPPLKRYEVRKGAPNPI